MGAKGHSQIEGLHYDETFALVTQYDSLRLIIALATHLGLDTNQVHMKSALLKRHLVEEIWLITPPNIGLDGKILRLEKPLYSLKQGPLAWFEKLSEGLAEIGFISLPFDPCVFMSVDHKIKVV